MKLEFIASGLKVPQEYRVIRAWVMCDDKNAMKESDTAKGKTYA